MARTAIAGIGIVPAGALGMGFFYHLTQQAQQLDGNVFFVERAGSQSAKALREQGSLQIADSTGIHEIATEAIFKPELKLCFDAGHVPEILLVCANPDQLPDIIQELVTQLECIYQQGQLNSTELPFPIVVLCANGIYFQRLRLLFLEKLEESVLFGRLPDLWPELMPPIVARILRGVTLQTGVREGSGSLAVYRPGPLGITRIAGGNPSIRQHCCQMLQDHGGWFEQADHDSATHLEFDKAMTNLSTNLLGQIYGIDDQGNFTALTIKDMLQGKQLEEIRELCHWVFRIGQAVKAYDPEDDFEERFASCMAGLRQHQDHIPSSVQWVGLHYANRNLEAKLTPTEAWLLGPLIRYARGADQEQAARYLEQLKQRLLDKLEKATQRQQQAHASH